MTEYCPEAGCEIFTKEKWVNNKVSDTFEASFWTIGNDVIYSRPKGFCDVTGVKKSLKLNDEVRAFISTNKKPFIQIEDYSFLTGSSMKARKIFIDNMNSSILRKNLIFCNANLPLRLAIKIGNQFNITNRDIFISNNYSDAVAKAKELHFCKTNKVDPMISGVLTLLNNDQQTLGPVDILHNNDWHIETEGFSNQCLVINKDILHSKSFGTLQEKHIPLIDAMRTKCQSQLIENHSSSIKYIVVDTKGLDSASRLSRLTFMKHLKKWAQKYPIEMYIAYNTSAVVGTAFALAKPLFPFKVKIAKNFKHALELITEHKGQCATSCRPDDKNNDLSITDRDVEKLLALIGELNWEFNDFPVPDYSFPKDHPFYYISQSINIIKEELDDLLNQRKELEEQLHQSQKMESIGRLAGGIAHDFNNILHMIIGNAELGLGDLKQNHPAYKNLSEIKSAGVRGAAIVKQLLNFSRKSVPEIIPVNAVEAINDTINFIRPTIPSTIEINKNLHGRHIKISADPIQIQQVIINIVVNASQAIEGDGGEITITSEPIILEKKHVQFHPDLYKGPYYKIDISDNGPGIEDSVKNKIFDPYFTTKEVGKGSGMGLAVVHGIIKNHKGSITLESQTGYGSKFTILLPQATETQKSSPKPLNQIQGGKERLMVVDDEEAILEMEYKILHRLGYSVEKHSNPLTALQAFKNSPEKFDLLIIDMAMPKMSGESLSKEILKINPTTPIIICTGHTSLIDEQKAKEVGISALMVKPVSINKLDKIIRQVVKNNQIAN